MSLDEATIGDTRITEAELSHFQSYLQNNVDIKDRTYHFKTYKDCFLGRYAIVFELLLVLLREAVTCFTGNSTICKSLADAVRIGNVLVEYGVIQYVIELLYAQ